jgi:hypothetical protein
MEHKALVQTLAQKMWEDAPGLVVDGCGIWLGEMLVDLYEDLTGTTARGDTPIDDILDFLPAYNDPSIAFCLDAAEAVVQALGRQE